MALTQQRALAVLELRVGERNEYMASDAQLGDGGLWAALLTRMPRFGAAMTAAQVHRSRPRSAWRTCIAGSCGVGHWHASRAASCDVFVSEDC
jgi:hypothetical protein